MANFTVAYEDGKFMTNEENAAHDSKKTKMKELCVILASLLSKHNKLRKV